MMGRLLAITEVVTQDARIDQKQPGRLQSLLGPVCGLATHLSAGRPAKYADCESTNQHFAILYVVLRSTAELF